ncbi:MAG: AMP-binding protein, partial [Nanohaloarchaea archaeon]|nr:AMP-binding protein [Candidatus Nanohaloarchaea archaeon]
LKMTSKLYLHNLRKFGLKIPETVIASTKDDLENLTEKLDFPIVCKGALKDSYIAEDRMDLHIYFKKIDELLHGGQGNVIFQEFIKGDFYCTTGVADKDSRLLRCLAMKKLGVDFKGSTWCGFTVKNNILREMTEKFIEITGWIGPFELEFICDSQGNYWLFEINPRLPAYIYLAAATGQNIPDALVKLAEGRIIKKDFSYDTDMAFTRLTEEVVYPKRYIDSLNKNGKVQEDAMPDKKCKTIKTFYGLLADKDDDKAAILYQSKTVSYRQLKEKINERCDELKNTIRKKDKVIIRSDETPNTIISIYALDRLGAVIIPVNPLATEKEIQTIINDLKADVIISKKNIKRITDDTIGNLPEDACMIFYTSGTTGKPKGIVHTKESIMNPCLEEGKAYGIDESDIIGGTPSLSSTYGFGAFAIIPFMSGASVSLYPYATSLNNFIEVIETIDTHKITVFFSIPTAYRLMVSMLSMLDKYNLNSLRLLITAGEPLGISLHKNLKQILPHADVLEHLGCTESFHAILSNTPENMKAGSIGKEMPFYKVRIFDNAGKECPPMVKGRLAYEGSSGKYIREKEDNGWKYTGDIAYMDENGYFWFVSRYDDLIKTAGYLISPHEIECALMDSQAVSEAAVIGVPDPIINQRIKAFVVLNNHFEPKDNQLDKSLLKSLKLQLPEYKIPSELVFVDSIPKNKRGKVLRNRLS